MDPPPPHFRLQDYRHLRYGNALHPPDFTPLPYGTHLPPPQLHRPHFIPPPAPSAHHPVRGIEQPPLSPPFRFSPPYRPVLGRSGFYQFDPPPEPYFNRNDYPPPPPPAMPPPEDMPLRLIRDYPERNPVFKDEVFGRGYGDDYIREIPRNEGRSSHSVAMEHHGRVLEIGGHVSYRHGFYRSPQMCNRDDDERKWDDGINNYVPDFYIRRDSDRRWNCDTGDRSHGLCSERDYDERRWSSGISDRGGGMCDRWRWNNDIIHRGWVRGDERVYDERKRRSDATDRDHAICSRRGSDDRTWNYGISDRGHELYRMGNVEESRLYYGGGDVAPLELPNRQLRHSEGNLSLGRFQVEPSEGNLSLGRFQLAHSEGNLSLGRFRGRLEEVVSNGDFIGSETRRLQRTDASYRTQPGHVGSSHSRGYNYRHSSKKSRNLSFRGKEKDGSEQLQTRTEDKGEREQSSEDLAILFKSNALIARTIAVPSSMSLNNGKVAISGSSSAKSSEDRIREGYLKCESDLLSNPRGVSKEFRDKVAVLGSRSAPTYGTNDPNENFVNGQDLEGKELQGFITVGSSRTQVSPLTKMRNAGNQLLGEDNLQMTEVCGGTVNSNYCINDQPRFTQLNSNTNLSKESTSAFSDKVSDTVLLSSSGGIISKTDDVGANSCKPIASNLKRKRSSLTTSSASLLEAGNLVTESSCRVESLTNTDDAYCVGQLTTNKDDKFVHGQSASLDAEKRAIESSSKYSKFCSDTVDNAWKHSCKDGLAMLESDFVRGHSEVKVSTEGHGMVGSAKTRECEIPERQEDKYYPESHELVSFSDTDCSLPEKPDVVAMSGIADANAKEISPARVYKPQVGRDAREEFRSFDATAGADSSNVSLGVSLSSNILSVGHSGSIAQLQVSSVDAKRIKPYSEGADLAHSMCSVDGSREAISPVTTHSSSIGCLPQIIGKRKARVVQMGHSDSKTRGVVDKLGSVGWDVARCFAKNVVPAVDVEFIDEKNNSKKDANMNKRPCGIEDSTPKVNFGVDGSFDGQRKKVKVASPRLKFSSLSDNDTLAGGFASDCSMLGLKSTGLAEQRAEQSEGILSASAATDKCCAMDVEGKVGSESSSVAGSDEALADGDKLQVDDELVIIVNGPSLSADRNGFRASHSGNELFSSGFGMRSCMSSPEEMPSYSDLRFSRDCEVSSYQSESEMICRREDTSNRKPIILPVPNRFSLGKSQGKAASYDSPTNTTGGDRVVGKLNILQGKLISSKNQLTSAASKVFPHRQPISSGYSRIFNPTHAKKSRTWHRTGNSAGAVTEPKVKPAPLPRSRATKTPQTMQSSYIRKGNSLVRKASPTSVTIPGFHVSSSSVYRLPPCTDNFKNTQAFNGKAGYPDALSQPRTEPVNMPEAPEELPLKKNCKPLDSIASNLGGSQLVADVPSNGCPSKPLDSLVEAVRSSAVECQSGTVNNSDNQNTCEEDNSRKKITYVKRRHNQLVASSHSDDISKLGVNKSQALSSDGYFKSKKYQLVRASSEDLDKQGDANVNSQSIDSHSIVHRTSSRRQSGFAKGYRSSKFSLVWKLHDMQSSEKRKKLLGPQKVWPQLLPWKKATHWRSFMHALVTKRNGSSIATASQNLLLSRKRGAIYKRSTHGYSLRISKVLSVGGVSLKWSKSIEKNSKKVNEEATQAVAAAEKRKKEANGTVPVASKSRNHVSRKLVLNVKLRPGERIFRIGSERYRMDPTRRTLHRITDAGKESASSTVESEKKGKRSYVPRRLLIGNDEYVRIGNGNKLVRDPKKRTRVLASEKVRWSLRTARLRLARKKKYCQFFTRFGKCNKDDGKCPYIHDRSKIVVCTKFLNGSCSNADCKLTHKVIPERMQDCSYFLKGSCSNENCPYRHVNVNPDSAVCESFLRGYCADGNECPKKHTYVCPAYEASGTCPQASKCKLHHPKKKSDKKPTNEQKFVRGRYFDGGLVADGGITTTDTLSTKGKEDTAWHEGKFPDYISLEVSDDERDCTQPDTQVVVDFDEFIKPSFIINTDCSPDSTPAHSPGESSCLGL